MKTFISHLARQSAKAGLILLLSVCALPLPSLWAVSYDLKEETPEVKTAVRNRQSRFETLQGLKTSGLIGENNRGYVEVISQAGASAKGFVEAENADRKTIYNAIVTQNLLPPSALAQVETAFAEVQGDRAKSGESIQLPSGQWTKK